MDGIRFTFSGKKMVGKPGDTIATALLRNGVRTFDRSIKLRRRRGPNCLEGYCMSCLLEVDGYRDVLSCRTKLENGMEIRPQIAWPTPKIDLLAPFQNLANNLIGYDGIYHLFTSPPWARAAWLRTLSYASGRGKLNINQKPQCVPPFIDLSTDVLVIGAGVAGVASALEAASMGLQVLIVDRGQKPGGWWKKWLSVGWPPPSLEPLDVPLSSLPKEVKHLKGTTLVGLYSDNSGIAVNQRAAYRIHFQTAIIAVGCYPNLVSFPGSDMPLYMPVQGLIRAWSESNWSPSSVVLLDFDRLGTELSGILHTFGTEVITIPMPNNEAYPEGIVGMNSLQECKVKMKQDGVLSGEAICWSRGWRPRLELIRQIGGYTYYDSMQDLFAPSLNDHVFVTENILAAGGCAGIAGFSSSHRHGQLAGAAAASIVKPATGLIRFRELNKLWENHRGGHG